MPDPERAAAEPLGVISSLVVQARPERLAGIVDAIQARSDAEIAAMDPVGKLVVVLETASDRGLADATDALAALPGVLSVALVYHHSEPRAEGQAGLSPDWRAPR